MKYGQELPAKVEKQLDAYIERIKAIKWFQPADNLDFKKVDKQIRLSLKCFGVEAKIEYRDLKTPSDWDAARDAAWGAEDLLALSLKDYKKKYPKGNFVNLVPLWEMGLYPCGVLDGKFIVYVPKK